MPEPWVKGPFVAGQMAAIGEYVNVTMRNRLLDIYADLLASDTDASKIESPIEAAFWIWWHALAAVSETEVTRCLDLNIQPEIELERLSYRLDFAVSCDPDLLYDAYRYQIPTPLIAVELDGHDFHERTKEQVIYRDERDRCLQRAGWRVFHFSGSAIAKAPLQCVTEVFEYAAQQYHSVWRLAARETRQRTDQDRKP